MASTDQSAVGTEAIAGSPGPGLTRATGWIIVSLTFAFLINVYLSNWHDWPGALAVTEGSMLAIVQAALYLIALIGPVLYVGAQPRTLREDAQSMTDIVTYIVRAGFWATIFVGLADMTISFLRVEALLEVVLGDELATELGRSKFRGPWVHMPLIALALLVAARTRTLGFHWLTLLVVIAELLIVLSRFIYSYEQAFQGDLVRFWYAALFLFASAYTLLEDGHVRVDVVYSGLSQPKKGLMNAIGCLLLGISLCVVILGFGMWDKTSAIISPMLSYEVSQSGFGMYVKYLMGAFLGIFAVTMMVQFASYLLESVADMRGEPGHRDGEGVIS